MKFIAWINDRFPLTELWEQHVSKYYVPKNLNFWYFFGVFSLVVLVNQFVTGIWLAMYYTPTSAAAFNSIEHIMRDVKFGWLIRYMHSTGASAFFIVIYLHMYRGIMYGSFKAPRELLWIIGMGLFSLLLLEAGSGYVLPWGQMSYWATKVLVGVYTVIPFFGKAISRWITGDFNVSGVTLHRFFALHVVALPLLIIGMVVVHIMALHHVGSNNPDGKELQKKDKIPFHPYYSVKDFMGIIIFLFIFFLVIFFFPTGGGYLLEHANFQPANPLVTPQHIAPPWYLASIYAILRSVPNKLMGVVSAAAAIAFLFVLPWLDRCKTKSIRYRGNNFKIWLSLFVISYIGLGVCGTMPLSVDNLAFSRLFMIIYFSFFIALPFHTRKEASLRGTK